MGRVKETLANPGYDRARENFVERLRAIAVAAEQYANTMDGDQSYTPDHLDSQVQELAREVANLAYIQGASSACLKESNP